MKNKELFVHVFFVDTISLSDRKLGSTEVQSQKLEILFRLITNSPIFKKVIDSAIISHTGDGVAICFKSNPRLPLELAIDLHKKLYKYNKNKMKKEKIEVRIGINSGIILEMKGVGNRDNYWGRGLIHAQRIMSIGDANHILITATTAKELIEISDKYKENILHVGNIEIKHGEVIPVYSAFGKEFGNKNTPNFIKQQQTREIEESGRLIIEALKKNEINPKYFLELIKQSKQSELSIQKKHRSTRS